MAKNLSIKILRVKKSYEYLRDPSKPFAWDNNDNNNALDQFQVYEGTTLIFTGKVQTVANMTGLDVPTKESPAIKFEDTVAVGTFSLKVGLDKLDPRAFYGRINGICNTKTLAGDVIGADSTTPKNKARWLNHDRQKHKPSPAGVDTRVCWSAGCFVFWDQSNLSNLGTLFDQYGYIPGDMITGELVEV